VADEGTERRREALIQAGMTLASELSLPSVLQKIIDIACDVADARYGALGVLTDDGTRIQDFITHGVTEEERRAIGDLPQGKGILGVLIDDAVPLRLDHIQDDPRSVGFPPHHPPMTSFLGMPIEIHGRVFGNLYLTEKRGGETFGPEDEEAVRTLATQAAVAIENARLYREAENRNRRIQAAGEVTHGILEGRPLDDLLRLIATRAMELVDASLATVTAPAGDGEHLVVRVAVGTRAAELEGRTTPARSTISEQVMRTGNPLLVPDLSSDERTAQPVVAVGGVGPGLFVPLVEQGAPFGTLLVANRVGGATFTEDDLELLRLFAGQASVALDYSRTREVLSRLAVMEDRERIAQEIHDGVIQTLFAVGMSLQATGAMAGSPEVQERLAQSVDAVDGAIRDLRNYIFGLRPGAMADRQLDLSIRELVKGYEESAEATVTAEVDPEAAALLAGRASDVLQLAREGISNAVRHAAATTIRLSLRLDDDRAVLEVRDDGSGFDPEAVAGTGHGLGNLESRARALGGAFHIASDEAGTRLRIELPV
jgi:signal transduction histidine kinase